MRLLSSVFILIIVNLVSLAAEVQLVSAKPGRAAAVQAAAAEVFVVDWAEYHSVVAIQSGTGLRCPAWVATFERQSGNLAVAYAGSAYRDASGHVHIDCQRATISGPLARMWSPDSFALQEEGPVRIIDDEDRASVGTLLRRLPLNAQEIEALTDYRKRLQLARSMVEGIL